MDSDGKVNVEDDQTKRTYLPLLSDFLGADLVAG